MANIKSAKKRILTNDRQRSENRYVKATISTFVKDYRKMLADGKFEDAQKKLISTISYIDSACSKGVIHKNNAARKIARLSSAYTKATADVKAEEVKVVKEVKAEAVVEEAPAKKVTKKATTKKAAEKTAEEAPAKKTVKKTAKKETK